MKQIHKIIFTLKVIKKPESFVMYMSYIFMAIGIISLIAFIITES